jgi:hypothetical protein
MHVCFTALAPADGRQSLFALSTIGPSVNRLETEVGQYAVEAGAALMRFGIAFILISCTLLTGCFRTPTYVEEPRLAPQDGQLNGQPLNVEPNTAAAPSSSSYYKPKPDSLPALRENSLEPVPRPNPKRRYLIQEARA